MDGERNIRVRAGLVATMVFWGSAFPASKLMVLEVPPKVAALLRFGAGSLLMMALLFRVAANPVPPRDAVPRLVLVSFVGVFLFTLAFFLGLSYAPASDGGMLIPVLSPVFAAAAGMLFLGEPVRRRRVAGLFLSAAGAVLFFWRAIVSPDASPGRLLGDAILTGAAGCWAASSILSRKLLTRTGAFPAAAWTLLLGSGGLLLLSLPELGKVPWGDLTPRFWVALVYLAVFPTVVAYFLWFEGIRVLGSYSATSFMFLAPLSALAVSAALLGERPTPLQGVGGALMLYGVWTINRS